MSDFLQPNGPEHFLVLYHLSEFAQTHVHWVSDVIQTFHSISSCLQSFPALGSFPISQLFASRGQSIGASTSVCPSNEYSGLISFRIDWFESLLSKGLSRVFSSTTVRKHQFLGTLLSLWSNPHIHTWLLEKPQLWPDRPLLTKLCLCFLICCLGLS